MALGILMMMAFTATAWSASLTIDGSNVTGGGNLVFPKSPNVTIIEDTDANTFTILSYSTKTDDSNGIEYAMISSTGFVYQKVKGSTPTASVTAGSVPTDFVAKGT
jgi:hypothetical protein